MAGAGRRNAAAAVALGLVTCLCCAFGAAPPGKPGQLAFASLGPNFLWNCQTAGHAGHCAKINRSQATLELIDELDIGVVTDFLPDAPARAILEQIKTLPDRCAGRARPAARPLGSPRCARRVWDMHGWLCARVRHF